MVGKVKKDRLAVISNTMIKILVIDIKMYRLKVWLFEGQFGGRYSAESV